MSTSRFLLMMATRWSAEPLTSEIISGDVDRVILTSDPLKGDDYFREIYLREVDRLAETLYVPNYRRPEVRRYVLNELVRNLLWPSLDLQIQQWEQE